MTDRPTPERIIKLPNDDGWADLQVGDVATHVAVPIGHGYVIVHPDDVPAWPKPAAYDQWVCR